MIEGASELRIAVCLQACDGLRTDDLKQSGFLSAIRYQMDEVQERSRELARLLVMARGLLRDSPEAEGLATMVDAFMSHAGGIPAQKGRVAWSSMEDWLLSRLAGGMPTRQIAEVMGRSVSSITQRAVVLDLSLAVVSKPEEKKPVKAAKKPVKAKAKAKATKATKAAKPPAPATEAPPKKRRQRSPREDESATGVVTSIPVRAAIEKTKHMRSIQGVWNMPLR